MIDVKRHPENPIFTPSPSSWESEAVFNGSVVKENEKYHLLYRAISSPQSYLGLKDLYLSTIGHAIGDDGVHFGQRQLFIRPELEWERFGCEDPRITKLGDKYYIFYTALSSYPPTPPAIKVGVAITADLKKIDEKHQVTYFNSKAMALFPEKINGKIVVILTANTDNPPAKIALAFFDEESQLWSKEYWDNWLPSIDSYALPLQRVVSDHIEMGAPPVKTEKGWLVIYSYIRNYFSPLLLFGIEAVLLDLENPLKIIGRTEDPLLVPQEEYELYGKVPKVVFPSGALLEDRELKIYYGAADTACCVATVAVEDLFKEMLSSKKAVSKGRRTQAVVLERYKGNPIICPIVEHHWESKGAFNPGVIYESGKTHLLYRAMSVEDTSVLGYASLSDGFQVETRLPEPAYIPREYFEQKIAPGNSGCEDPRLTKVDDKFYMCYTAFDGKNPWRVALTSISVDDFLKHQWNWEKPILISPPGVGDKDACIVSEKINGKYMIFHRIEPCIWVDYIEGLTFVKNNWIRGKIIMQPRTDKWDGKRIGIAGPPIKTKEGWLLIYHGVSTEDDKYRLGAALLSAEDPSKVRARLDYPILEPEVKYEKSGQRPGAVFSCGSVVLGDKLVVYYGAADHVIGIASINLDKLLEELKRY